MVVLRHLLQAVEALDAKVTAMTEKFQEISDEAWLEYESEETEETEDEESDESVQSAPPSFSYLESDAGP